MLGPGTPVGRVEVTLPEESQAARLDGPVPRTATGTVPALFAARVAATPTATAVVHGEQALSYAELNARANRLAHRLLRLGVRPEDRVAVLTRRSEHLVVALLAVLKAGAAYVGLDPRAPAARTHRILDGTSAAVLLADGTTAAALGRTGRHRRTTARWSWSTTCRHSPPSPTPTPNSCCTQASWPMSVTPPAPPALPRASRSPTGTSRPSRRTVPSRAARTRVLVHSPTAFDASTYELWVPLLAGGTAVVAGPDEDVDAAAIGRLTRRHGLTALWLTAGLFRLAAEEDPGCFTGLRQVWAVATRCPPLPSAEHWTPARV